MDTVQLETARKAVADLEAKMLEDVSAKAAILGFTLVKDGTIPPASPKQKRHRRTKAEIEVARATCTP